MPIQDAIERLQREKVMSCYNCVHPMVIGWCENKCTIPEAYNMAIEALEKQRPKKPIDSNVTVYSVTWICPTCDRTHTNDTKLDFCSHCGQAIDWSEE